MSVFKKQALGERQEPHGKPHQINIYRLDAESHITGRGTHKRCVVLLSHEDQEIQVRVDDVVSDPSLTWPTDHQVQRVANHPDSRMHAKGVRLDLHAIEEWENGSQVGIKACKLYRYKMRLTEI